MAEPGLYLIAACLVALRPLLKWSLGHISTLTSFKGTDTSQDDTYIMQTRSFTVSKADRFHQLDDERSLTRA
jgi:hypothetical protein